MKNIIKKIITEEINQKKDRLYRYILKSLQDENFNSTTSYSKILKFIKSFFFKDYAGYRPDWVTKSLKKK